MATIAKRHYSLLQAIRIKADGYFGGGGSPLSDGFRNRCYVMESLFFPGELRLRRTIQLRFARLTARRWREFGEGSGTDIFRRIQIEFHQGHMRGPGISPEDSLSPRSRFRIDCAPSPQNCWPISRATISSSRSGRSLRLISWRSGSLMPSGGVVETRDGFQ
jgi:hypothetical protein